MGRGRGSRAGSRRPALAATILAAGAVVLVLAGCGSRGSAIQTHTVENTRVEVIRNLGTGGTFDPRVIYSRESPGVVTVLSIFGNGAADPLSASGQAAEGSGFVISAQGEVVTNAHVVTNGAGASLRRASQVFVRFADDSEVPARIVGTDANADVALLRIDPAGLTLRPLPLGSSANLTVGAPVAAIGSPFGEPDSLSVGVISGTDRTIASLNRGFAISGAVQTDAAINHGNSGGPLVDSNGQVIGINAQIGSSSGGGEGVGFAVPVDTVKRSLDQLRAHGSVSYAYLGVSTSKVFPQLAARFGLGVDHGAWVQRVDPGPARDAGVRAGHGQVRFDALPYAVGGDVIVSLAGHPVRRQSDLAQALAGVAPGQGVAVELQRGSRRLTVQVRTAARPAGGVVP